MEVLAEDVKTYFVEKYGEERAEEIKVDIADSLYKLEKKCVREMILKEHKRPDGRGLTDLRPPSYITYAKQLLSCSTNSADMQFVPSTTVPDSYINLVSPEICTMKESIEPFFDNAYIDPLYGIGSYLGADGSGTWNNVTKNLYRIFAIPGQYKSTENKYYSYDAGSL